MKYYYLEGREIRTTENTLDWARRTEAAWTDGSRAVGDDHVGAVRVSTVFLGVDHNFFGNGPPLLFETMVFGGPLDREQERCATWDEAVSQHAKMLLRVLQS